MKSQESGSTKSRGGKKKKLWIAIELEDVKKYEKIVKPKRFAPVGGKYLRELESRCIIAIATPRFLDALSRL